MFFDLLNILKNLFCFTGSYSNDVFPEPLSVEEEEKCIKGKMEGNIEDRNKLIEHNLRLVAHIIKKFDNKYVDSDDLISIGTIGLIKGVDTFSSDKGVKITTYCARCIENEILMYFRSNNRYNNDISINDAVGFDKDGNEIAIMDVLKTPNPDFVSDIDLKDNIELLKKYINITKSEKKYNNGYIYSYTFPNGSSLYYTFVDKIYFFSENVKAIETAINNINTKNILNEMTKKIDDYNPNYIFTIQLEKANRILKYFNVPLRNWSYPNNLVIGSSVNSNYTHINISFDANFRKLKNNQ